MIIGICGQQQSGKDTIAKMIQYYFYHKKMNIPDKFCSISSSIEKYEDSLAISHLINSYSGWKIRKFASKLKQISAILLGCKEKDFESEEFKNSILPSEFQSEVTCDGEEVKTQYTVRWFLQTLGTEVGRNINKDIWINSLFSEYNLVPTFYPNNLDSVIRTHEYPNWIISDVRFLNEAKSIKDRNGIIFKNSTRFKIQRNSSIRSLIKFYISRLDNI